MWICSTILISVFCLILLDARSNFVGIQILVCYGLMMAVAASAAGSFHRERETGFLELLLVSPLNEQQILGGRLRGLWSQFMPAVLLLVASWLYLSIERGSRYGRFETLFWTCSSAFFAVPIVGLYYSLRRRSFISAWLCTLATALFLPNVTGRLLTTTVQLCFQINTKHTEIQVLFFTSCIQIIFALWTAMRLHRNLIRRSFAMEKGE